MDAVKPLIIPVNPNALTGAARQMLTLAGYDINATRLVLRSLGRGPAVPLVSTLTLRQRLLKHGSGYFHPGTEQEIDAEIVARTASFGNEEDAWNLLVRNTHNWEIPVASERQQGTMRPHGRMPAGGDNRLYFEFSVGSIETADHGSAYLNRAAEILAQYCTQHDWKIA